jgi:putative aminopeptidase FrvX
MRVWQFLGNLQKLADAAGPPGFEEPVRAVLVG